MESMDCTVYYITCILRQGGRIPFRLEGQYEHTAGIIIGSITCAVQATAP